MNLRHYVRFGRYILKHKWFVFVAGLYTRAPLWRLLIHDWSKFTPIEFFSYAEFFNGDRSVPRVQRNFERGKLNHFRKNAHHWNSWILFEGENPPKPLPIPESLVREMVADWIGASRAITGRWSAPEWYAKEKDRMLLHVETRERAEAMLQRAHQKIESSFWRRAVARRGVASRP